MTSFPKLKKVSIDTLESFFTPSPTYALGSIFLNAPCLEDVSIEALSIEAIYVLCPLKRLSLSVCKYIPIFITNNFTAHLERLSIKGPLNFYRDVIRKFETIQVLRFHQDSSTKATEIEVPPEVLVQKMEFICRTPPPNLETFCTLHPYMEVVCLDSNGNPL